MSQKILTILMVALILSCQSHENTFILEGKWVDVNCTDPKNNCSSRYPIIIIDSKISDSLFVMDRLGKWERVWTNNKWQSYSLRLENDYETLLFPNYQAGTLQYYDEVKEQFIYYKKSDTK